MVNKNSDFKYFIFPNVSNAYLKTFDYRAQARL